MTHPNANVPQPGVTELQKVHQHRHTSVVEKLAWFEYEHIGHPAIKSVVARFNDFIEGLLEDDRIQDTPQLTIGLQHLIEAKDAISRAAAKS